MFSLMSKLNLSYLSSPPWIPSHITACIQIQIWILKRRNSALSIKKKKWKKKKKHLSVSNICFLAGNTNSLWDEEYSAISINCHTLLH